MQKCILKVILRGGGGRLYKRHFIRLKVVCINFLRNLTTREAFKEQNKGERVCAAHKNTRARVTLKKRKQPNIKTVWLKRRFENG